MPLPSQLVFNELSGDEAKHVLQERFRQLLDQLPYLQRHITLPRVRMKLAVTFDFFADDPTPERQQIQDELDIKTALPSPNEYMEVAVEDEVSTSRSGGKPPDQVRDEHGISIPTPVRGPIAVEDVLTGHVVEEVSGMRIDRTGGGRERGTVVNLDFGVAGLANPKLRDPKRDGGVPVKNQDGRGGPVTSPKFREKDFQDD